MIAVHHSSKVKHCFSPLTYCKAVHGLGTRAVSVCRTGLAWDLFCFLNKGYSPGGVGSNSLGYSLWARTHGSTGVTGWGDR